MTFTFRTGYGMNTDLTPILEALAANPGSIAAWEIEEVDHPRLAVFVVSGAPRQIVFISAPQPQRKGLTEVLATAGHPTGYYAAGTEVVWRNGPEAFEVWSEDGRGLKASKDGLFLGDGTALNPADATAVIPFTGAEDVARGVKLRLGEVEYTIAIHFKHLAAYIVDFEDGKGWRWIGWVSFMAHQLAKWLDVPVLPRS